MREIKAILIGGSNTVMRPGYVPELPRCFQPYGIDLRVIANLPVGNTSILMGLMQLKANVDAIRASDVLFIEYTLNDSSFYSGRDALEKWSRGYEGAIRYARMVNPRIKIVAIILANQRGLHRTGVHPLHAGVHYLASYYDCAVADVNADFVRRFGSSFFEQPGTYQDAAHYQRPLITNLAAEIIAQNASEYLLSSHCPRSLPDKLCDTNYAECGLIRHVDLQGPEVLNFKNYLFNFDAIELVGHRISLEIESGSLVAAQYISVADAAKLYVQANGVWHSCLTLKPGMVEPKYKFLVSMIDFQFSPSEGVNRITLTTSNPTGEAIAKLAQVGGKEPVRPEQSLPIASIMHTGKITSIHIEKDDRPAGGDRAVAQHVIQAV